MLEKAAQTAFEQKDVLALEVVQTKCGAQDRQIVEQINTYLAQLRSKK